MTSATTVDGSRVKFSEKNCAQSSYAMSYGLLDDRVRGSKVVSGIKCRVQTTRSSGGNTPHSRSFYTLQKKKGNAAQT